ncbi:MAG: segregation and condensation protein A [Gammaproteobacteria bacterium]
MPHDLYIPPDALKIFLETTFEGPLDLLLYLIKRQNLDILDIPIAKVTRQYIDYIELMVGLQLELAADYLVMAAMLAEIKSRLLLPRPASEIDSEEDPRAELVRRLQEYEQIKKAAHDLDELPQQGRDVFLVTAEPPVSAMASVCTPPPVKLPELLWALKQVMQRVQLSAHHHVQRETLSIRERMSIILGLVQREKFLEFNRFFNTQEGRMGVVVTFIALLELLKQSLIEMVQTEPFSPIHVRGR